MFMYLSIIMFIVILALASLILLAASCMSMRAFNDRSKASPFECGFDPKKSSRLPFSLRFFLLTILFLVFDIEVILLFPAPWSMNSSASLSCSTTVFIFSIILILGLLHEWNEGSLEWTK